MHPRFIHMWQRPTAHAHPASAPLDHVEARPLLNPTDDRGGPAWRRSHICPRGTNLHRFGGTIGGASEDLNRGQKYRRQTSPWSTP